MRNRYFFLSSDTVESLQGNLDRAEPVIGASYGVIGAIMMLGGMGLIVDRYLHTAPWALLAGLMSGLILGGYLLTRVVRR